MGYPQQPGNEVGKYKYEQLKQNHGTVDLGDFEQCVSTRLHADDSLSALDAMKNEVWSSESKYILKGEEIPESAVSAGGGLGRCLNITAVWDYNMGPSAKERLDAQIERDGSDKGKANKADAFAWLANNVPAAFDPNADMAGSTRGAVASGWWYALRDGGAVDLAELREELTLNDKAFEAGVVRLEFPVGSADMPKLVKPTAVDGLFQGGAEDPMWASTTGRDVWGLTKSEQPVREGVTGPIDVNLATKRTFVKGSVPSEFAPATGPNAGVASSSPTATPAPSGTDYLAFLNGPSNDARTGAANTQRVIDCFNGASDKGAGEASARSALQGIISSAGWSGGASEFEAQWTRFKQHNAHVSWS